MTKRDVLTKAQGYFEEGSEEYEVIEKMIIQLDKKTSKPTKVQIENANIKTQIKTYITENPGHRVGEIAQAVGYSPNKVNALIVQLRKAGEIERYEEKGIAYFK